MICFKDLGVNDALCEAIKRVNWTVPTEIQQKAIPPALEDKDIIGLAKTGSGKTGAFTIPILQALMDDTRPFFAVILTPTRDLAIQIQNEINGLGKGIGVKCVTLIGGLCEKNQAEQLLTKPHIIIATPGRFVKHIATTKGFNEQTLKNLKFLVMDEADRMLSLQFEHDINKILMVLPRTRRTYLFSATNTDKVNKLQRASLKDPVRIIVDEKYADSDKLKEFMLLASYDEQNAYLVWLLKQFTNKAESTTVDIAAFKYLNDDDDQAKKSRSVIVFVQTKMMSNLLAYFLKKLGLNALPINSDMTQEQRTATIHKMKMQKIDIMIATDVAARGLDIPNVDVVIHYDLPESAKTYTHRAGRTARAGKKGVSILMINQYFALRWVAIEEKMKRKLPAFFEDRKLLETEVLADFDNMKQCYQEADTAIKSAQSGKSRKRAFNLTDEMKKMEKKRKLDVKNK